jgi:hypothetical protein
MHLLRFLSPLRGWFVFLFCPTACAVGWNLAPLRGWSALPYSNDENVLNAFR